MQVPNPADFSRYYADIRQSSPASYQEMNSALAELSGVRNGPGDPVLHIWRGEITGRAEVGSFGS